MGNAIARGCCIVAEEEGDILGFLYGTAFAPDIIETDNLLVAGRARGRGIAREMARMALVQAREQGYRVAIMVASELYGAPRATAYHEGLGTRVVASTGPSDLLVMDL